MRYPDSLPREQAFDALVTSIRSAPDAYLRREDFKALGRRITRYDKAYPRTGGDLLQALLTFYFQKGSRARLLAVLRRAAYRRRYPPWLRFRVFTMLAGFSHKVEARTQNYAYRQSGLAIADSEGWQGERAVLLNNWLFAAVELNDLSTARRLEKRVRLALASLQPSQARESRYRETKGRFRTHQAKLRLLEAQRSSTQEQRRAVASAGGLYRRALALERASPQRRVNILVEWAASLLTYVAEPPLALVDEIIERAGHSLDVRVSDPTRAYFYVTRGRLEIHAGDSARYRSTVEAVQHWQRADADVQRAVELYRNVGRHLVAEVLEVQKEVKMRLTSYTGLPADIRDSLERFRKDYPDPSRTVFVMMRFGDTSAHKATFRAIDRICSKLGYSAVRADYQDYHDSLHPNVLTYIWGSGLGVAVFERIEGDEFNPNVAFEVGYMLALGKSVCLLKERTLKKLPTDLLGKLYKEFNVEKPEMTIRPHLDAWFKRVRRFSQSPTAPR